MMKKHVTTVYKKYLAMISYKHTHLNTYVHNYQKENMN